MGIDELLSLISDYNYEDKKMIIRAYEFASQAHKGVLRKSGEPYITHPLQVAIIVASMHADADTICACLLHDCIEDIDSITAKIISDQFNETISFLVDGVTKIDKFESQYDKEQLEEASLKKLIEFMCEDVRIIIIKLADRLHNMRTLQYHKLEKQKEIAKETMEIYVTFAELIGAYDMKLELEDLAFKYLNPIKYNRMVCLEEDYKKENQIIINEVLCGISQILNSAEIPFDVKLRVKNYYGLYKRLCNNDNDINKVHDLFQIKYVLNNVKNCYTLRSNINKIYPIVKGKSKDYIVSPKTNKYRALHTSVYYQRDKIVQFQLATKNLDMINTYGLSAYWKQKYDENPAQKMQYTFSDLQIYQVIKEIISLNLNLKEFSEAMKKNVLSEKIYVLTPNHETVELPIGSTPIDFAYKIHTDIGNCYKGAKVNGVEVGPGYRLKNKDIVEISFQQDLTESQIVEDLSVYCATDHAKRCIKEQKRRLFRKLYQDIK